MHPGNSARREFIKTLLYGTAFSSIAGALATARVQAEIIPLSFTGPGLMRVKLGDFPALQQPFGSVRLSTSPMDEKGEKQKGLFPPIIINRGANEAEFYVCSAECTHEGCTVQRFNPEAGRIICPCHGSQYLIDGTVVQGPAGLSLRQFNFTIQENTMVIEMPDDLFFQVEISPVKGRAGTIKFEWIAFSNITYELLSSAAIGQVATPIAFALTPEGPFDQLEFSGADDFATLYFPASAGSGFVHLAMKTSPV